MYIYIYVGVYIYIRYIPNIYYSYIFYIRQLNPAPNCSYFPLERNGVSGESSERGAGCRNMWVLGRCDAFAGITPFSSGSFRSSAPPPMQVSP